MDAQAIRDMLKTDLLFVVIPVMLGFTFNFVALFVILHADLIWQGIISARRTHQQSAIYSNPATRPHPNTGGSSD
jgi:hypothetical protein